MGIDNGADPRVYLSRPGFPRFTHSHNSCSRELVGQRRRPNLPEVRRGVEYGARVLHGRPQGRAIHCIPRDADTRRRLDEPYGPRAKLWVERGRDTEVPGASGDWRAATVAGLKEDAGLTRYSVAWLSYSPRQGNMYSLLLNVVDLFGKLETQESRASAIHISAFSSVFSHG